MPDLLIARKTKVSLNDFNYQDDIDHRIALSKLTPFQIELLSEILFNPLIFPISELGEYLDENIDVIKKNLIELESLELYKIDADQLIVNKEMRKLYSLKLAKFDKHFSYGIDLVEMMLKRISIHLLPVWYQVPRTSTNIFESIIENYFITPKIYSRHLLEFIHTKDLLSEVANHVIKSPQAEINFEELIQKMNISEQELHKVILELELNFIVALKYIPQGNKINLKVSLLNEWKEYNALLLSKEETTVDPGSVVLCREKEYAFIEDMSLIIKECSNNQLYTTDSELENSCIQDLCNTLNAEKDYIKALITKLTLLHLIDLSNKLAQATEIGLKWINIPLKKRAHITFKHPLNQIMQLTQFSDQINTERNYLDVVKSLSILADKEWILLEDYFKGVVIPLTQNNSLSLKKCNKRWAYIYPTYTEEESEFIRFVIFHRLFESGIIQKGKFNNKPCFKLTTLGKDLY